MRKAAADLEFEEAGRCATRSAARGGRAWLADHEKKAPLVGHSTEGKPGTRKTRYGKQQQMRMNKRGAGGRR
jgi:excinuclease ABC subunit B